MNPLKLLLFLALTYISAYSQKTYVFFGSYNHDKDEEGLYIYQLDTITGNLEKTTALRGIHNPSYITLSPNGHFLYACTESKTLGAGSVSSFAFDSKKGTLTFLNSQKSGGENPVYITIDKTGKWLVNGNYTEASVSIYPISKDGLIGQIAQNVQYREGSINKNRQDRAHIHSAAFSPDFNYVFFTDLGADKIRCYNFNNALQQPLSNQETFTRTIPGSGPRHFTFHPNGKFAYCIEELSGMASVYKYGNGKLESIQRIAAHSKKYKEDFESSDIHISPDGKFLYATNRGIENNIAIFSINYDGTLKIIGYQSSSGEHPRTFAIDPTGKFIIVTNVNSNNAVVFKRNIETGLLQKVKEIEINHPTCVKIKNY